MRQSRLLYCVGAFLLASGIAEVMYAEVVTIEVTIKSVDAKAHTITATLKDKTLKLDVSQKAEVTINGEAGEMDALAAGQTAKIDYETTLEIITKIEATGDGEELPGEVRRFEGHTRPILSVAYSPTGKLIASGGGDKTVRIWNVEDESEGSSHIVLSHPVDKPAGVVQVAFSPDAKLLVSSGADGSIRVWDATASPPKLKQSLKSHAGMVKAMAFSPDGQQMKARPMLTWRW